MSAEMALIKSLSVYWLLTVLQDKAASTENTLAEHPKLYILPLFRAPNPQERQNSSYPIIWSAHETENSYRMLPTDSPAILACLLDDLGSNNSASLQSLVWTLANEAGGQVSRYTLQGPDRDFQFEAIGERFKGHYSKRSGSTLIVASLHAQLRVSCEYQAAGLNATIKSDWLLLWDEQAEFQRLQNANLHCNRTIYKNSDGGSNLPLAVTYSCLGLGDTRLLESAVVALYAKFKKAGFCSAEAAVRESHFKIFSNSSGFGKNFFGVAFNGYVRFGWTMGAGASRGTNVTAHPGAQIMRRLDQTETCLCLMLQTALPSARIIQLHFPVPQVGATTSVTVSPEKPLIVPLTDGDFPTEVQLDKLLDPLPDRTVPCLLLCLQTDSVACRHRWVGPGQTAPPRSPPDSQPLALQLRFSDNQAVGIWTCRAQLYPATSVAYAISSRPRPAMCGPRLPRRVVLLESQSITINCSLCGLSGNASTEFDVYVWNGAANYSIQRLKPNLSHEFAELSVKLSVSSSAQAGAMILLRCRGTKFKGEHSSIDFSAVNLLPLPEVKSLDICPDYDVPCRADCRSPIESQLRSLGVSIVYLFYIYSESGQLQRVFSSSGVLNDVRLVTGNYLEGVLKPICRQVFHYINGRSGLASFQSVSGSSKQLDDLLAYQPENWEQRNRPLIFPLSDDLQESSDSKKNSTDTTEAGVSPIMYMLLLSFGVAGLAIFMAVGVGVNEWKKDVRNIDPNLVSDDAAAVDAGKNATSSSDGKQAGSRVNPSQASSGGMGATRQVDQKAPQTDNKAVTVTDQKTAASESNKQHSAQSAAKSKGQ